MHKKIVVEGGNRADAKKALVMLHGRGGSAQDILSLSSYLKVTDYHLYAPQATGNTWYPQSFLAAPGENEPWLTSALELIGAVVDDIGQTGIPGEAIYFLGFSQGACLALEYIARHAALYGGVVAFTGGLIGDRIYPERYRGDFRGMPVFIGTSDPDFHVPVERVHETADLLRKMGAEVTEKVYPHMGHTISHDEIVQANHLIFA